MKFYLFLIIFFISFVENISAKEMTQNFNVITEIPSQSAINQNDFISAIAINNATGKIVYTKDPDLKIYPASLTKMMTAYIVFDSLDKKIIGINDKIKVGIKEETIYSLLAKMLIQSDNQAATLLAKEIGNNEENFVKKMNEMAKTFQMKNTNFINPHGLFHKDHYSTAHDILILTTKLNQTFPKYMKIFVISDYADNGIIEPKTTQLDEYMKNIDGSKTGYISEIGYNIAAWGNNVYIVAVGIKNQMQRDIIAVKLMSMAMGYKFHTDISLNQELLHYILFSMRDSLRNYFNQNGKYIDTNYIVNPNDRLMKKNTLYNKEMIIKVNDDRFLVK